MVAVAVTVNKQQLAEVTGLLGSAAKQLPLALSNAVNDTAKREVVFLSKRIRETVAIKAKDIKKYLKRTRATPGRPVAHVELSESDRLPLKYFSARQTAKGVSYKIQKSGGRELVPGAFGPTMPRLGHHAFKREGKKRFPIIKLHGPSPGAVAVASGIDKEAEFDATVELEKNVNRRIKLILLRKQGIVK